MQGEISGMGNSAWQQRAVFDDQFFGIRFWWSRWDSNPRPPRCHRKNAKSTHLLPFSLILHSSQSDTKVEWGRENTPIRQQLATVKVGSECPALNSVLPFQSVWKFVSGKFKMDYPSWFGHDAGGGGMEEKRSHKHRTSPRNRANHAAPCLPCGDLF
jgi:hypothetical protein